MSHFSKEADLITYYHGIKHFKKDISILVVFIGFLKQKKERNVKQ